MKFNIIALKFLILPSSIVIFELIQNSICFWNLNVQPTGSNPSLTTDLLIVDRVESIEVGTNQLVIKTTKHGPADTEKVEILVFDIASGEWLPPVSLTGILLLLTRGHYHINHLKSSRWYGILFHCEQTYIGGSAMYVNEEEFLIRTKGENGSFPFEEESAKQLISMNIERYGDSGKSLENLVIRARWEQQLSERAGIYALIDIILFCREKVLLKQLKLETDQANRSIEIHMENEFIDIHEYYDGVKRFINALIRPKNCQRVCWNSTLNAEVVSSKRTHQFKRFLPSTCEAIGVINASSTALREFTGYTIIGSRLFVHTTYADVHANDSQSAGEKNAMIKLTAIELPPLDPNGNSSSMNIIKEYSTETGFNDFIIDKLKPNQLYAVQYSYKKESPFIYEETRRFIVDTSNETDDNQLSLIRLIIEYEKNDSKKANTTQKIDNIRINSNHSLNKFEGSQKTTPILIAKICPEFRQYEVGIDIDPFCKQGEHSRSYWLLENQPRILRELPIVDAVCDKLPNHNICPKTEVLSARMKTQQDKLNSSSVTNKFLTSTSLPIPQIMNSSKSSSGLTTHAPQGNLSLISEIAKKRCPLGSKLCYTVSLRMKDKIYSMQKRCEDIIEKLPLEARIVNDNKTTDLDAFESGAIRRTFFDAKFILLNAIVLIFKFCNDNIDIHFVHIP